MRQHAQQAKAVLATILFLASLQLFGGAARADQITCVLSSTDGSACERLTDEDYSTTEHFEAGTEITVSCDDAIDALYVVWEYVPGPWVLRIDGDSVACGEDGFLHEFIKVPEKDAKAEEATVVIPDGGATIADIYALSAGELPSFVQMWEPSYDEADILFVSTHADDECLFLGGAIPTYCNRPEVRVQLAYFCDFWQTEPYRNHEILNGLWTMGVTHYPQLGEFKDVYSETLEEAAGIYDYGASLEYLVRTLRRFKPQVVVGQDIIAGEYGHGAHMWSAKMIADALEPAADEGQFETSAEEYGTWDVPKTYFHLYTDGVLELDARQPLDNLGGQTALELAKAAFLEHRSQQYIMRSVDDGYDENGNPNGYPYSCTKYGLYRSLVGTDSGMQDMLEHIETYDAQAEAEARAQEEAERAAAADKAKQAAGDEAKGSQTDGATDGSGSVGIVQRIVPVAVGVLVVGIVVGIAAGAASARRKKRARRQKPRRSSTTRHRR